MDDIKKPEEIKKPAVSTPDSEVETGQGTSPDERSQFECHESEGEECDATPVPQPAVDALHPKIVKVERVENAERPKDERALFGCDANGKKCDA